MKKLATDIDFNSFFDQIVEDLAAPFMDPREAKDVQRTPMS